MAVYAVGDIHGCYDEWIEFKNKIEGHDPAAMFILVGDIVDRGPKQKEILDWALENITEDGKYQMIMGNHEDMKIGLKQHIKENMDDYGRIIDGYGWLLKMYHEDVSAEKVIEYIEWMEKLPLYKDITVNNRRFILVHGGISKSSTEDNKIKENIDKYIREDILWNRDVDNYSRLNNVIIVHGHTPTLIKQSFRFEDMCTCNDMLGKIYKTHDKYNIDCGLVFKDRKSNLAALNLNTLEELYLYNN